MTAAEFRALREAAGLSQERAARVLGTTLRTVSRWETGSQRIPALKHAGIRQLLMAEVKGDDHGDSTTP